MNKPFAIFAKSLGDLCG